MKYKDMDSLITWQRIYNYYYERLVNIALAQFDWKGLPDTCDRLYLEKTLLFRGTASIYKAKETDLLLSTGYLPTGGDDNITNASIDAYLDYSNPLTEKTYNNLFNKKNFNVYGYPAHIIGIGFNAEQIKTDEWVILYDNMSQTSLINKISLYAILMAETHMSFRTNLKQQNTPYIVETDAKTRLSIENLFNRTFGAQPVIQVTPGLDKDAISVLDLRVDFKSTQYLEILDALWEEAIQMLGISTPSNKKERLITNEIDMDKQEDIVTLNSRLLNRREFAEKCNAEFGTNISVNMVKFEDEELEIDLPEETEEYEEEVN